MYSKLRGGVHLALGDACSGDHLVVLDFGIVESLHSKPLTHIHSLLFLPFHIKVKLYLSKVGFSAFVFVLYDQMHR